MRESHGSPLRSRALALVVSSTTVALSWVAIRATQVDTWKQSCTVQGIGRGPYVGHELGEMDAAFKSVLDEVLKTALDEIAALVESASVTLKVADDGLQLAVELREGATFSALEQSLRAALDHAPADRSAGAGLRFTADYGQYPVELKFLARRWIIDGIGHEPRVDVELRLPPASPPFAWPFGRSTREVVRRLPWEHDRDVVVAWAEKPSPPASLTMVGYVFSFGEEDEYQLSFEWTGCPS